MFKITFSRLAIILGLIFVLTIGGVFATWSYASTPDVLDKNHSFNSTIKDFVYFDEVVIKDVTAISNTLNQQDSDYIQPTEIKSTLSGSAGQKVVYKVTARNYSKTDTYVYAGASTNALNGVTITVYEDEQNTKVMESNLSANAHEGTPIAPSENFVFYISYTLTKNVTVSDVVIEYVFKPIIYTVTYLNSNQTFAVEHVTNNQRVYNVTSKKPQHQSLVFAGWVNANAVVVNTIPVGNTNNYTLSASWENVYLIIFADVNGNVLYQEQFTDSSKKLSDSGQAKVDQILADLNAEASKNHMIVSWSEYDIASAKSDITVKAIYAYNGILNLVPVYEQPDDGIVDYYKVVAVDTLPENVLVPSSVGGIPIKVVERIANTEGENDWNNYAEAVKTITVQEGVERLEWNSLAWTPNLSTVKLPSTITYLAKNTFSRNDFFGNDKKVLTIEYNGTIAEWKALVANSDKAWDGGLQGGSVVLCKDGYLELSKGLFTSSWKEKSY